MMHLQPTRSHNSPLRTAWIAGALVALATLLLSSSYASAANLDEMPLERWKELREVERYQLNIAERYYKEKNWKVALDEYNKFITLYETSIGAPYAQLKWSICQVNLKKPNTAIKEGYQSVIDYWPDSPDAVAAAYYIGKAYEDMGEVKKAKKAYQTALQNHPEHLVAIYSMVRLVDLAGLENDTKMKVTLWNKLTFDTPRAAGDAARLCVEASQQLAVHHLYAGSFSDAQKALATTYPEKDLPHYILHFARSPLNTLTADEKSKPKGDKLVADAIAYVRKITPADLTKDDLKALARNYWFNIADLHSAARQHDKVPGVYDQMISKFGVDDEILGRLAQWYKEQNQYDKARETYARFVNKIEGLNQIGLSFRQQGNVELAVQTFRRLAAEDNENEARWVIAVAGTYWDAKQYKEYIAVNEELLKIDPDNVQNYIWNIAYGYHVSGQYKEAIARYRQSERIRDAYWHMASCHRALQEYNEALLLYNQIMGLAPEDPSPLYEIGATYEQAGKKELAIKSFQTVCKKFPKTGKASEAHAHLQNKYNITITLGGAGEE